jgi:hypothetical protein
LFPNSFDSIPSFFSALRIIKGFGLPTKYAFFPCLKIRCEKVLVKYSKATVSHMVAGSVTSSLHCQEMQKYDSFLK